MALRSLSFEALDYLTTFGFVCQVLFSTFFSALAFAWEALSSSLTILPHSVSFVKHFFDFFQPTRACAWGSFEQPDYLTTLGLICQVLFFDFFQSALACAWGLFLRACLSYHTVFGLSSSFFRFFEKLLKSHAVQTKAGCVIIALLRFCAAMFGIISLLPAFVKRFFHLSFPAGLKRPSYYQLERL